MYNVTMNSGETDCFPGMFSYKAMIFKKLTLDDIPIIKPYYTFAQSRTCDFSVGGMFMWRRYYDMDYCIEGSCLFSRLKDEQGTIYYNLPLCEDVENALLTLRTREKNLRFCTIPEEYLSVFMKVFPQARITEQTDYFDYLYTALDLIELRGGKYHGQRNQISQFIRQNPDWRFVDIKDLPIGDVIDFFSFYCRLESSTADTAVEENQKVLEVLQHMEQYQMLGGVLLVHNQIVGFSLGEIIGEILFTHVEKADRTYRGVYQMLTKQFAEKFGKGVRYINREEDMGDLGLRRAKESYHPVSLLKKYVVEVVGECKLE